MLKAVFYTRFHPTHGPSVIHQYPPDSIVPSNKNTKTSDLPSDLENTDNDGATAPSKDLPEPLVTFSSISASIIPAYELCDAPLSICSNGYRVLGLPVSLEDAKYERNRFTFNVAFVLDESTDAQPWHRIVAKTAAFFTALEVEDGVLQAEEESVGLKWAGQEGYPARGVGGKIFEVLEALVGQVNGCGEACVRVSDVHVLNLRLESERVAPPEVKGCEVPMLVRALPAEDLWTRDLTLLRILPYINGVRHVQRIAEDADVEMELVQRAVRELVLHGHVRLLDLFHFQAIYVATAELKNFTESDKLQEECRKYVINTSASSQDDLSTGDQGDSATSNRVPKLEDLRNLYSSLTTEQPLHDFVLAHTTQLTNIDIRRFITFGLVQNLLRRIHKYGTLKPTSAQFSSEGASLSPVKLSTSKPKSNEAAVREFDRAWKRAALSSGWATPPSEPRPPLLMSGRSFRSGAGGVEIGEEEEEVLRGLLDGRHCFDEVCVAMRMAEGKLLGWLKGRQGRERMGEVVVVCR
ncbi:hypothetical protein LTR62_003141 [Meristemomyces frigidus]|uniref:Nitrogen permease regulator 2 n=1 Tax=Meristemomyces frigidus TaxID=1508187 RepID=A0AAN7TK35_9PEZI|nr:hypothetical protein LTR62_003141 [Meristemomyces frigidus]